MSNQTVKKIAILGAESTGKTTLARQLAQHYNTIWLPEYGREYVEKLNRTYKYNDVLNIAKKQVELEEQYLLKAKKYLFIDTELINIKVWLLHVYKDCPQWVMEAIKTANYSFYLICDIDLLWEFDAVRENPHIREYLSNYYIKEVESYGFPYAIIREKNNKRLENAIKSIEEFEGGLL